MLRIMRSIRKRTLDREKVERLYLEKEELHKRCEKRRHNPWYAERLKEVKNKINRTMFMPDYVTVVMEHKNHYKYMFEHGFFINGKKFVRMSCSAGQARVSTVVFCAEDIAEEVERRINNGRDPTKKLAASKFNAYFGLSTSATFLVSEPRFAVVKDYKNTSTFMAHWDTETEWSIDDEIDTREVSTEMDRMDGMGLISPEQSAKWAMELGLDYTPSEWIVRQSFLKGMLCTFPFHEFCEEVNEGNYLIDTVYQNEDGSYIKADLREVDVIVSESQFKLWDSWPSMESYVENYHKNGLSWGVASYTPKVPKDILTLNYQFIQTLNLNEKGIEKLTAQFVDWIEGVSVDKREYMLLFLLGTNHTQESIERFISSGDKYWLKALVSNPECSKDPYIRLKIRDLIRNRIKSGCMGEILVDGNFQMMVSDPYAFMEHVCGMEPTGLLKEGECYCHYWNERGVDVVNLARSPQTYRCENVITRLAKNEQTEKWYRYCQVGMIFSWHGHEAVNLGGSDYDGDIVASTNNEAVIKGVYRDELTVTYEAPTPAKSIFTKQDLFNADLFSFGSMIGSITNKGTNAYALLPLLEEEYGPDSEEVKLVISRLQQCCVAQSKQIDKAKLGRPVKGIPDVWIRRQKINEDDDEETRQHKQLMNRCLIDRRPYFFRYRYADSKKEHDSYKRNRNAVCQSLFGLTIDELEASKRKTQDQRDWLRNYHEFSPLIESDSTMNLLCKHIEQIDFQIVHKFRDEHNFDPTVYIDDSYDSYMDSYKEIASCYDRHLRDVARNKSADAFNEEQMVERLKEGMSYICSNPVTVTNCLVRYLMIDKPRRDIELLWMAYGRILARNALANNVGAVYFPFPDEHGDILYLGRRYTNKEVSA